MEEPRYQISQQFEEGKASKATALAGQLAALGFVTLLLAGIAISVSPAFAAPATSFFFTIGIIACWRYGWWFVHLLRAREYLANRFPKLRQKANQQSMERRVDHFYVLITSYFVKEEWTIAVYDALIKNAISYGAPTTIVAAITEDFDQELITRVLAANNNPVNVEILVQFQKGNGKRDAMAEALRAIARRLPSPGSLVIMMDGDVRLDPGAFEKSAGFFLADKELGALTTNNAAFVEGGAWLREWYALRYAQRHIFMASLALSKRLLVLTGRFSVYKPDIATDEEFINLVGQDSIQHWRFGRIPLLSGDDKSAWYYLLKHRKAMLYVPDVFAIGFESLPRGTNFFTGSSQLMHRWFRNMLQSSGRAIALGPRGMGLFMWWSLVDQRLSMWTTLIGPVIAVLLAIAYTPVYLVFYLVWIMGTRLITSGVIGMFRGKFSIFWPVLQYYTQVCGALIKTYALFRLNRQKWTRQGIDGSQHRGFQDFISLLLHAIAMMVFVYLIAFGTGLLNLPGDAHWILWRISFD